MSKLNHHSIKDTLDVTNNRSTKVKLIFFTLILLLFFFIFSFVKSKNKMSPVDLNIINNEKIKKGDQIRLKVHSVHHSNEDIKKISQKLIDGQTWEEAHKGIPKKKFWNHIIHIDTEFYNLILKSFFVTFAFLLYQVIYDIILYFSPKDKGLALWFIILCFITLLIVFAIGVMMVKHNLSFLTNNPNIQDLII